MLTAALVLSIFCGDVIPKSETAYRFLHKQELDDSCGYAVVASFLSIYSGISVNEETLLDIYPVEGDGEISFADMRQIFSDLN